MMPILVYFFVAGTALLGLLFYANAHMEPRGPLAVSTNFEGLPQPWHGPVTTQTLAATPAPAPDMSSDAVLAAAPPAGAKVAAATSGAASEQPRADLAKKKKRIARRMPQPEDGQQHYAQSGSPAPFGFFGRF
jgi:hypothetical protein